MKNIISTLALVAINFKTNINGNPLQFNSTYTINGANTQINFVGYYITDIKAVKTNNTEISIGGIYLVKGNETLTLTEELDAGNYKALTFKVGIADSLINHGDPSLYNAGDPLALQTPSMHWSWNTGYIFFRLDGLVDTSANNQHGITESLTFHLGRLSSVRTVTINQNFSVVGTHNNPGQYEADVVLNVEDVLAGIDIKTDRVTMTMNNPALATKACDNLPDAFEFSFRTVTSVAEKTQASTIVKLYPNPSQTVLNIEAVQPATIEITDMAGKTVLQQNMNTVTTQVNISTLPNGIYFVKQAGKNGAARFVKQ
jgi:hypothetical protein